MDSELVKFVLPVLATMISPIIIFLITRAANKENDKMAMFNARVDFLRKLIELQDKCEELENTNVKTLLKHEIDYFYEDVIPVLREETIHGENHNRASIAYKRKSKLRRILLFYRHRSLTGLTLQILYYLLGLLFLSFTYSVKFEFSAGEVVDVAVLLSLVLSYFLGIFSVMYLINYASKRIWISTFISKT